MPGQRENAWNSIALQCDCRVFVPVEKRCGPPPPDSIRSPRNYSILVAAKCFNDGRRREPSPMNVDLLNKNTLFLHRAAMLYRARGNIINIAFLVDRRLTS